MKEFPCETCITKDSCDYKKHYLKEFKDHHDNWGGNDILIKVTEECELLQEYFPYEWHPDPDCDELLWPDDCGISEEEWIDRAEYITFNVFNNV